LISGKMILFLACIS